MAIEGRSINLPFPYPDLSTQQWDAFALLRNLQFLASKITAIQTGQLVPTGTVQMFVSGSTCPAGYTKVSVGAGRYLRLSTGSGGGTGGSLTVSITDGGHTHGAGTYAISSGGAHTHGNTVPSSTTVVDHVLAGATIAVASSTHVHTTNSKGTHTHTVSGASASATTGISGTIAPTFLDVILCTKD